MTSGISGIGQGLNMTKNVAVASAVAGGGILKGGVKYTGETTKIIAGKI